MRWKLAILSLCAAALPAPAGEPGKADPWEGAIQNFEKADAQNPPPKGAVLFLGSSSIVGWNLKKHFPNLAALNRGFGGSQIADSLRYVDRIVVPYAPKTIVFYAGDNDIASGKKPEEVLEDFQSLVKKVRDALPKTRILFIAIKPSLARWKLYGKMSKANDLVAEFIKSDERLQYVDVAKTMLGEDGKPRPELFVQDGLHLSAKGYELWTSILLPHLK